jgi:phosphomannomutase
MTQLTCFKAYDIRGKLGTELNEEIAIKLAVPMGKFINLKSCGRLRYPSQQ